MKVEIIDGITVVSPVEGKYLTNGEVYSDSRVYLGILDSPDNWTEVDENPKPEKELGGYRKRRLTRVRQ